MNSNFSGSSPALRSGTNGCLLPLSGGWSKNSDAPARPLIAFLRDTIERRRNAAQSGAILRHPDADLLALVRRERRWKHLLDDVTEVDSAVWMHEQLEAVKKEFQDAF